MSTTTAKRLIVAGNSLAFVLDKPVLEATGITRETALEVSTDGDVIMISPVRSEARTKELKTVLDEVAVKYAGAFRRLAE
jgi:antitoxin component of MazEF toxin-antitoxin module